MEITKTADGKSQLHLWRTETSLKYSTGSEAFNDWTNIKFTGLPYADEPRVLYHFDFTKGKPLPFKDQSMDIIYINRIHEHLSPDQGIRLTQDIYRLLKPGGICRIVVPDLEMVTQNYLNSLRDVLKNPSDYNNEKYEWDQLMLYDQMVRRKTGGRMQEKILRGFQFPEILKESTGDALSFYTTEFGDHQTNVISRLKTRLPKSLSEVPSSLQWFWKRIVREFVIRFSGKSLVELYKENVLTMYDQYSATKLMRDAGFNAIKIMDFKNSQIGNWDRYNFDQSSQGDYPVEPSLYIEAIK